VTLAGDCIGSEVKKQVEAMQPEDVLLLENLRFHKQMLLVKMVPLLVPHSQCNVFCPMDNNQVLLNKATQRDIKN
jgi:hypothetical protein